VRAYLLALGLTVLVFGLFLMFAGFVNIGCPVGGTPANPTVSSCAASNELELGGALLTVVAVLLFGGTLVPESSSRYK
jgi:hypothetical protein